MKKISGYHFFRVELLVCIFLVSAVLMVYQQVLNFDFIDFDDQLYVFENEIVQSGLSLENIEWAFSFDDTGEKRKMYWHPLTWLSHMLDCQLFGLQPGMHHWTNLIIHIANSLLLFLAFNRMTGALCQSTFVAALLYLSR